MIIRIPGTYPEVRNPRPVVRIPVTPPMPVRFPRPEVPIRPWTVKL